MDLFEYVKNKMEIRHNKKDDVIMEDIKAAALNMSVSGVNVYDEEGNIKEDRLIWNAIANYCMWHDNTHGKAEQYMRYYKDAVICMGNCGDYAYVQ